MSRFGTSCEDCVRCEGDGCPLVAYCLSEPGTRPCAHDKALCDDCRLESCTECRVAEGLERVYRDPFDHGGEDPDPWGPLAAEGRAVNDRFWSTVVNRTKRDAS